MKCSRTRTAVRIRNLAAGALAALAACRPVRGPAYPDTVEAPDQTMDDFTMDSYAALARVWSLRAPHADIFEKDHRVELTQPRIRFFSAGRPGSTVAAAQGRLDTETKDMWAGGGVVMVSTEGARLESDWVRYEKSTERFVSTAAVTITRGRSVVTGIGWQARSDLSDLLITHQRGEIAPEDERGFKKK